MLFHAFDQRETSDYLAVSNYFSCIYDIIIHTSHFIDRSGRRLVIIMSLKITHTIVIILSIMLTSFYSYFMVSSTLENALLFSIIGVLATIGLSYYLFSIVKKFKTI